MKTLVDRIERAAIGSIVVVITMTIYIFMMVGIEEATNSQFYDWFSIIATTIALLVSILLSNEAQFAFVKWKNTRATKLNFETKEGIKKLVREVLDEER